VIDEVIIGLGVRISPSINGLLGVTHDKKAWSLPSRALEGYHPNNVALQTVRVLKLVNEKLVYIMARVPLYWRMIGQEPPGVA
jgi:hypothetical protein